VIDPILEVIDLKKSYFRGGTELPILKGVTFSVERGQSIAIIGQSGSGKSTLLSLLSGLDSPGSGSVVIDSQNIFELDESKLAKFRGASMGIVFQQFHLMPHLTALENVMLPLEIQKGSEVQNRAIDVLRKVGLESRASHYPHQLSGGECQRVAIARAFVVNPRVLFADEPSGNLDRATGDSVMSLLFDLARGNKMTMILVTHNEGLAAQCDRRMHLQDGVIIQLS
jgi:putative ABC transport system ATP-binding protein